MFRLFTPSKRDLQDTIEQLRKVLVSKDKTIRVLQQRLADETGIPTSIKTIVKNGDVPMPGIDY